MLGTEVEGVLSKFRDEIQNKRFDTLFEQLDDYGYEVKKAINAIKSSAISDQKRTLTTFGHNWQWLHKIKRWASGTIFTSRRQVVTGT
jgi:hypothetical protein